MRDNWVNWLRWGHGRLINYGQMRKDEVAGVLREFEATAAKVMEKTVQITSCTASKVSMKMEISARFRSTWNR